MLNSMYDYFVLRYGSKYVVEFSLDSTGVITPSAPLPAFQQEYYDKNLRNRTKCTEFHAYTDILNEHGYVMYEVLCFVSGHRWNRVAMLKTKEDNGDVKGYAVDITRIKNNPVMKIDMPNEMLWWGPVTGIAGIKRRDLIIFTYFMRGMPQKHIAETMCLSVKTIERVLKATHTDLLDMFCKENTPLEGPTKTLRELCIELDILPFLMRKLDWFDRTPEYLLLAPLNQ